MSSNFGAATFNTHDLPNDLPKEEGQEPALFFMCHIRHRLLTWYPDEAAQRITEFIMTHPNAQNLDNLRNLLQNSKRLFNEAALIAQFDLKLDLPLPPPEHQPAALPLPPPEPRPASPPLPPLPASPPGPNGSAALPPVQPRPAAAIFTKRTREEERLKKQHQRSNARKRREQQLRGTSSTRQVLSLPPKRQLTQQIQHAALADIDQINARKSEIEDQLGIGLLTAKALKRRETQRATRASIIVSLEAKIVAEKSRHCEMIATQPLEEEWLALDAQAKSTKGIRKDLQMGGLLSESDSDGGEDVLDELPSVPTKTPVAGRSQAALEARLEKL